MKWPFTWGDKALQEIFWNTSEIKEDVDTVMVKGRRVKSAPGLRFSDADGLAVAKRSGWIMSFGKMQDLDLSDVYLDFFMKLFNENFKRTEPIMLALLYIFPIYKRLVVQTLGFDPSPSSSPSRRHG